MARTWRVVVFFVLTGCAFGQALIDAPIQVDPGIAAPTDSHINKVDRILMVAAVASIGADAWATDRNWTARQGLGRTEINPIARVFVSHGTAPLVAYFGAGAGAFVLGHHQLARRHKKLAVLFDMTVLGAESYWTQYSLRHHID